MPTSTTVAAENDGQQQTGAIHCNVDLRMPHPKQLLFIRSKAKRKIIRAGRRGGKTTGVATLAVEQFLAGRRVLYATPTADQIKKFWSEVTRALADMIQLGAVSKNESEHSLVLVSGRTKMRMEDGTEVSGSDVRIRAKTAWNADTLRGDYADVLILDEWQLMNESAWEEVGAPMLIDNNGDAVFVYTPPSLHSTSVTKARDLRHASKMYKKAQADTSGRWLAVHFTSYDNPYVSERGIAEITIDMTALAHRQEIMAEDIDEVPGALWTRKLLEETRVERSHDYSLYTRIVVGVDPSGSSTTEAGIVAAGQRTDGQVDILADRSLLAPSPRAWASAAVELYYELGADRIVGERNYGGDMVKSTVETVDDNVSYKDVQATRGKMVRAEPIAALYEKGMAHNAGKFDRLEEEQCSYVPGNPSPNRMDAMVWAVTELVAGGSLGLVEWFKQGHAAALNEQLAHPVAKVVAPGELGVKIANDKTPHCPECNSMLTQSIAGGMLRCGQCGVQWWPNGKSPSVHRGQSRSEYLAKAGG